MQFLINVRLFCRKTFSSSISRCFCKLHIHNIGLAPQSRLLVLKCVFVFCLVLGYRIIFFCATSNTNCTVIYLLSNCLNASRIPVKKKLTLSLLSANNSTDVFFRRQLTVVQLSCTHIHHLFTFSLLLLGVTGHSP